MNQTATPPTRCPTRKSHSALVSRAVSRRPGIRAATAAQRSRWSGSAAGGDRLADRGDDEDQERRASDEGKVAHAQYSVQENGHQAAEQAQDTERGEYAETAPEHGDSIRAGTPRRGSKADDAIGVPDRLGISIERGQRERAGAQVGSEHAAGGHGHVLGEQAGRQRPEAQPGHVAPGGDHRGGPVIARVAGVRLGSRWRYRWQTPPPRCSRRVPR